MYGVEQITGNNQNGDLLGLAHPIEVGMGEIEPFPDLSRIVIPSDELCPFHIVNVEVHDYFVFDEHAISIPLPRCNCQPPPPNNPLPPGGVTCYSY